MITKIYFVIHNGLLKDMDLYLHSYLFLGYFANADLLHYFKAAVWEIYVTITQRFKHETLLDSRTYVCAEFRIFS